MVKRGCKITKSGSVVVWWWGWVWELVLCRVYVSAKMIQNIKVKNICIVSQTEFLEILVRMAIPTRTTY